MGDLHADHIIQGRAIVQKRLSAYIVSSCLVMMVITRGDIYIYTSIQLHILIHILQL